MASNVHMLHSMHTTTKALQELLEKRLAAVKALATDMELGTLEMKATSAALVVEAGRVAALVDLLVLAGEEE